ncbi:MAG: hypothetical protein U0930_18830 [Pirellulales bacterium]
MPKNVSKKVVDQEVSIDRRRKDRRDIAATDAATETVVEKNEPAKEVASEPRRKQQRRRQIDPTTCEREYTDQEIQFMHALDNYKRSSGRMFPTCSEILEVIRGLGYAQLTEDERAVLKSIEEVEAEIADVEFEE